MKPGLILMALALLVPATGCTTNAKSFWKELNRQGCLYLKKCNKGTFKATFDSMADCKEEAADVCDPEEFADICDDYDSKMAGECLSIIREEKKECQIMDPEDRADCNLLEICGIEPGDNIDVENPCAAFLGGDEEFPGQLEDEVDEEDPR